MIKVDVRKDHIEIKGHAMYDVHGKDIVCASVSCIVITSVNAILRFDKEAIKCEDKDGYVKIDILKHTKTVDTIILNMIELLEELKDQYNENITIYREV